MIKWFKSKSSVETQLQNLEKKSSDDKTLASPTVEVIQSTSEEINSLFHRFKVGLKKTSHQLSRGMGRIFIGKKEINAATLEELEALLLQADFGIQTAQNVLKEISQLLNRKELLDGEAIFKALEAYLERQLSEYEKPLLLPLNANKPFVMLMVGINGAGKTTTIAKLARKFQIEGKKVLLAAGDTYRAAAVEQLKIWGEQYQIPVIAQQSGADCASVIYDAFQAAIARKADVLIADTAGRLHTQNHLMEELKKIKRVLQKLDKTAPDEIMLVIDASIGQNALNQAKEFHQALGVTGITMTKLDGSAKGGILFAIANTLNIPFRYLGLGEKVEDLQPFKAKLFVKALLDNDSI